jgi:hypothetical protein
MDLYWLQMMQAIPSGGLLLKSNKFKTNTRMTINNIKKAGRKTGFFDSILLKTYLVTT